MVTEFDCVITYHHNIHTCGVARFNRYLADFLKIPMVSFTALEDNMLTFPLISIKESEMLHEDVVEFYSIIERTKVRYSVVFHSFSGTETEINFLNGAEEVMALNAQMASEIFPHRADVLTGYTVATPLPNLSIPNSAIAILPLTSSSFSASISAGKPWQSQPKRRSTFSPFIV